MRRRPSAGSGSDWRPKPVRVHRGGPWARANRRKVEAERRRRLGRTLTLAVGMPLLVLLAATLLFGERGLWRVAGMADHQRQLKRSIAEIQAENGMLRAQIERLKSDPATIESIARERLGMGRKGETVYYFPPPREGTSR